MSVWISSPTPRNADAVRDACRLRYSDLRPGLAVPHAAKAHRLARLFRAQQKWAELMDRHEEGKKGRTDIDRL